MKQSLRALLTGVIDYAGLFPPAELSLDESIRNYARYRGESEAWMLGRFVCPSQRLLDLSQYLGDVLPLERLRVSAIARKAISSDELKQAWEQSNHDIVQLTRVTGRPVVESLDVALADASIPKIFFDAAPTFFEPRVTGDWRGEIGATLESMRHLSPYGFKLRTGGLVATAFPPCEQIAFAIASCRDQGVPIKFTAGLHHPIRHFNKSVNTKMHGFINVFVAVVLAHAAQLDEARLVTILEDEDPASFRFDDDALRWKDRRATTDQIASIRRDRVVSFGSCSFDEPRDDLRALGWL